MYVVHLLHSCDNICLIFLICSFMCPIFIRRATGLLTNWLLLVLLLLLPNGGILSHTFVSLSTYQGCSPSISPYFHTFYSKKEQERSTIIFFLKNPQSAKNSIKNGKKKNVKPKHNRTCV